MKYNYKMIVGALLLAGAVGAGLFYYTRTSESGFTIQDFDDARDTKDVIAGLTPDRYWLFGNPEYSAEFMLKYRARQQDIMTAGQLIIKVARENGKYVGFTAYYMKPHNLGHILFVNVVDAFRGKGNVEKLVTYAMNDLKSRGAVAVQLLTRVDNERAQKVYRRMGFVQVDRIEGYEPQEGYVYFDYSL